MVKPEPREAALILLRALQERGERRDKPLTRARISAVSLKTLWMRETLAREWFDQVNEWLLSAGWLVIDAGTTYAAVKVSVIENWPRVASRHLENDLQKIKHGKFSFAQWEKLLAKEIWMTQSVPMKVKRARTKT